MIFFHKARRAHIRQGTDVGSNPAFPSGDGQAVEERTGATRKQPGEKSSGFFVILQRFINHNCLLCLPYMFYIRKNTIKSISVIPQTLNKDSFLIIN